MSVAVLERDVQAIKKETIVPNSDVIKFLQRQQEKDLQVRQSKIDLLAKVDFPIPSQKTFLGFQPVMWQIQSMAEGFVRIIGFLSDLESFAKRIKSDTRQDDRNIDSSPLFVGRAQYYQSVCRDIIERGNYLLELTQDMVSDLSSTEEDIYINERDIEYIQTYAKAATTINDMALPLERAIAAYIDREYEFHLKEYNDATDYEDHPSLASNDNKICSKQVYENNFDLSDGNVILFPYTERNSVVVYRPEEMPSGDKKTDSPTEITPIYEGVLDRAAFAEILENLHAQSGLSVREFCEVHKIQRNTFKRIIKRDVGIEASQKLLNQLGVRLQLRAI